MLGLLSPLIVGAVMAFSSVSVVLNSIRLRRFAAGDSTPPQPTNRSVTPTRPTVDA